MTVIEEIQAMVDQTIGTDWHNGRDTIDVRRIRRVNHIEPSAKAQIVFISNYLSHLVERGVLTVERRRVAGITYRIERDPRRADAQ